MSIERDKDFERLEDIAAMMVENPGIEFENGKYVYYGLDPRTAFAAVYIGGAWAGWQAAKAQAVPEGFVLVKMDVVERCMSHICLAMCHQNNSNSENDVMQIDLEILESALEAQEPK